MLVTLKAQLAEIANWQAIETNQGTVRLTIHDCLYVDTAGLPEDSYGEDNAQTLTVEVLQRIWLFGGPTRRCCRRPVKCLDRLA